LQYSVRTVVAAEETDSFFSFAAAAAVCNLLVCLLGLRSVFTSVELGEREEEEARAELLSWV
jgi:hypothetical protein